MFTNYNELLIRKNLFQEITNANITTKEDVLKVWKDYFKKIEKILEKYEITLSDFEVGKRKTGLLRQIYFYPGTNWGFISFDDDMSCGTYKIEDIVNDLYHPGQIGNNLISLLMHLSEINNKKINKIKTALAFVNNIQNEI